MKALIILAGLILTVIIGLHVVLQNGVFIRFLDEHPDPDVVPGVEYWVGTGYYLVGDLQNAATYYWRITNRYPKTSYSDDAYFHYIQSQDDMDVSHSSLAEGYSEYLQLYPNGHHVEVAQRQLEYHRNMR